MTIYPKAFLTSFAFILVAWAPAAAQTTQYDRLSEPQKRLFGSMARRIDAKQRRKRPPSTRFAGLSASERSTFAAVTNALANTPLTDAEGGILGPAIDLLRDVELIAGARTGKRSDEQYRLYVTLHGNAVTVLERSREFKRGKDNTRFHLGYPRNYRQVGDTPTLQFSISKDGGRADIDVDYRSSGFPAALLNGHLKPVNSDVRAPGNYFTHVLRWPGLLDFWRTNLAAEVKEFANSKLKPLTAESMQAISISRDSEAERAAAAVNEFLSIWLIQGDPDRAVNFVGTRFLTCPPPRGQIEDPEFEVRLRILFYNLLKVANRRLGKRKALESLIQPYGRDADWLVPAEVNNPLMSIASVRPGKELKFACRDRAVSANSRVRLGSSYVATFKFRSKTNNGGVLSLLVSLDQGLWRIQAFDAHSESQAK